MENKKYNWGNEIFWTNTSQYSSKILIIKEGHKTDKIFSKKRDKSIIVLQGILQLQIDNTNKIIQEGETYHISPNIIHQLIAIKGDVTIIEVGTEFIEADIVKIDV